MFLLFEKSKTQIRSLSVTFVPFPLVQRAKFPALLSMSCESVIFHHRTSETSGFLQFLLSRQRSPLCELEFRTNCGREFERGPWHPRYCEKLLQAALFLFFRAQIFGFRTI